MEIPTLAHNWRVNQNTFIYRRRICHESNLHYSGFIGRVIEFIPSRPNYWHVVFHINPDIKKFRFRHCQFETQIEHLR